jgi:alpha,alpha-trehalase
MHRSRQALPMMKKFAGLIVALCIATPAIAQVETPSQLYGQLFEDVQMTHVFRDGKTFVDAVANDPPATILERWRQESGKPGFDLSAFVRRNFTVSRSPDAGYRSVPGEDVCRHIDSLWRVLERAPDKALPAGYSSLLPLPAPYVVPGGRFNEIYYWDSYFTMLGLEASGRHDLALSMEKNFVSLIDRFGHIPNGNRSYYLSRSQPPFFASMVELVAADTSDPAAAYAAFLPALAREYAFWMEGADTLKPGMAYRRVVRLKDGTLLNRYWDDSDQPRDESYAEDVATARASNRQASDVYRDLRAAAESGWDFSSRWLADGKTLATIRTTALVPVDLNSILFQLETTLARAYSAAHQQEKAKELAARARLRKEAVRRYLWDLRDGMYADYLWQQDRSTGRITAATFYPLFFGLATPAEAHSVAKVARANLLKPGGIVTTTIESGQQWDAPNGWAPLQWIAVQGLANYGETSLGQAIARRWMNKVVTAYRITGKLMEKYNVADASVVTGGGEYPTQDGFGWTNGVLRRMLVLYPGAVTGVRCPSAAANDNLPAGR